MVWPTIPSYAMPNPMKYIAPRNDIYRLLALVAVASVMGGCDTIRGKSGVYGPQPNKQNIPTSLAALSTPTKSLNQEPPFALQSTEIPTDMPGVRKIETQPSASKEAVEAFTPPEDRIYRLGPGDEFSYLVRGRNDISQPSVIVAPDGMVALPRVGLINIEGKTLGEASDFVTHALKKYYEDPEVTLLMQKYTNNRVFVLGQVLRPGVVNLPGSATLLEALALAGGVVRDYAGNSPPVDRAIIGRGKDKVIWLDIRELLESGNMALNANLKNGDVVFVPQGQSKVAFVLGQVRQPGPVLLRTPMTVLEALTRSGGLTADGDPQKVYLVRRVEDKAVVLEIDTSIWIEQGDLRKNIYLTEGDLIYAGERGVSRFNYYITRLLPSITVVDFANTTQLK